ncbi:MAG TPA: cytochrome c [Steroidobacteraceae bacterium]|nr:cytochrome c [Steroidobacteraceae bacterium]
MRGLKRHAWLRGLPLLGGLAATVWGALALADDSLFTSTAAFSQANGAVIYSHICQGCHMPEGQGAVGAGYYPKLAGDRALASWQYPALIVLGGRNGMPPFGLPADQVQQTRTVHLSDAQIAEVVNYVRTHFGNHYRDRVSARQIAGLPHPRYAGPAAAD